MDKISVFIDVRSGNVFKAILFDLDGTLLPLEIDVFVKGYFSSLAANFIDKVEPKKLIATLQKSLYAMLKNDGQKTNEEVFMENFLPAIKKEKEEMYPLFDKFYIEEFPKLKKYAGHSQLSRKIVDKVHQKGYSIALATNPVFPRMATEHRMEWAGIKDQPWQLVTTYEDSYSCKPNPDYFKMVCERLGVEPAECLMIGNDVQEDLIAGTLGMKTFLVSDYLIDRGSPQYDATYKGTLEELVQFVDELPILQGA